MTGVPESSAGSEFGRFTVIRHRRELLADGRPVELGGRAFDTLVALIDARGTVLGKDELLRRVWPDRIVDETNLAAQIYALRKVFGADRGLIRTVAGVGYQFTGEVRSPTRTGVTAAPPTAVTRLPVPLSELIGRQAEVREVMQLVTDHRLVTLTGSGGVGKTRLGLEAARQLLPVFPDGAFFADLAPLAAPDLVPVTVATALGLPLAADAVTPARIGAAMSSRRFLLVLDNCEHLVDAAAQIADVLMSAGPHAALL